MPNNLEALRIDFPERLSGRWGKFSRTDKWFTLFMLAVLLLANHFFGKKAGLATLMFYGALMFPTDYGRVYVITAQGVSNAWLKRVRNQIVWDAEEEHILKRSEPIDLAVHGLDDLGFLHGANNKDTVVVVGEGSDLTALEIEGQYDSHLGLAEVIRKAAALSERRGHNVGWGWHYRSRPLNLPNLNTQLEGYLHPNTWDPDTPVKPEGELTGEDRRWFAYGENIQQLIEVTDAYAREVTMAAVCTIQREGFDRNLAKDEARRLPIVQLAQVVAAELAACGVIDPRALSSREIHAFLRGAWDILHIDEYNEWLSETSDEIVLSSYNHLPQERITAGWDYLQVDGSFHAVLWLKKFPDRLYPNQLRQLFSIAVPWLSVSQVGGTTSTRGEYAFLDRMIALTEEFENKAGVVHKGPKKRERQESRVNRQQKVHESRYGQDYNILVAVHHINKEGLEDSINTALQQISLANLTAERVTGHVWQLPFLLSATTAIDLDML